MLYDHLIKNLISGSFTEQRDVLFRGIPDDIRNAFDDNVKTVFLMPSAFSCGVGDDFCDIKSRPSSFSIPGQLRTVFADVRFMADEDFRRALTVNGFSRIAVLFPECRDKAEYGYRQSYGWIGEYRAERDGFVQVAGFISPCCNKAEDTALSTGSTDFYITGCEKAPSFSAFEATSSTAKYYAAAAEAEKYVFDRTVIYFNSREEAASFRAFLAKRGTRSLLFDGTLTKEERNALLSEFMLGDINLMIATKAYIASSLFYPAERVIFCGVPFSQSHLYRCSCACKKNEPLIIYCQDDITRNERLISSFSEYVQDEEISEKRLNGLLDMKNMLKGKQ